MSKKFFLLIALTCLALSHNNQIFSMERQDDYEISLDPQDDYDHDSEIKFLERFYKWVFGNNESSQIEVSQETMESEPVMPSQEEEDVHQTTKQSVTAIGSATNNQEPVQQDAQLKAEKQVGGALTTFLGASFDKKTLMYFGVGAVALITIGSVTYVLYKNGKLKKVNAKMQQFVKEHKVGVTSAVTVTAVVAIAAICAKKYGVTFEQAYGWVRSLSV